MEEKVCMKCGHVMPEKENYCTQCGSGELQTIKDESDGNRRH